MLKALKKNWLAVVVLIIALAADLTATQQVVLLVIYVMIRQDQLIDCVQTNKSQEPKEVV